MVHASWTASLEKKLASLPVGTGFRKIPAWIVALRINLHIQQKMRERKQNRHQMKSSDRYKLEGLNLLISSFVCWKKKVWEPLKIFFTAFQCFSELCDSSQRRHTFREWQCLKLDERWHNHLSQKIILDSPFTCPAYIYFCMKHVWFQWW